MNRKFRAVDHPRCDTIGCFRLSAATVVNNKGAKYGHYCRTCVTSRLRELEEAYKDVPNHEMPVQ